MNDMPRILARAASLAIAAAALAACGGSRPEGQASQTAAKVNKEEITVHQINFVLGQQRAVPPELAASASRQVLERLIDQELAMQKAGDQKLDRDPRVDATALIHPKSIWLDGRRVR